MYRMRHVGSFCEVQAKDGRERTEADGLLPVMREKDGSLRRMFGMFLRRKREMAGQRDLFRLPGIYMGLRQETERAHNQKEKEERRCRSGKRRRS